MAHHHFLEFFSRPTLTLCYRPCGEKKMQSNTLLRKFFICINDNKRGKRDCERKGARAMNKDTGMACAVHLFFNECVVHKGIQWESWNRLCKLKECTEGMVDLGVTGEE